MPKRLIDGESLWKSRKLTRVSPRYRSEYANLIPLAEANGVFECDPERVWAEIYAYNRPDMSVEDVVYFLDEFEKAGMLSRWEENGKIWGYWVGIEKHLPPPSAMKRGDYGIKKGTPNPPEKVVQGLPLGDPCGTTENHSIGVGVGVGVGVGLGLGQEESEQNYMRRRTFEAICHRHGLAPDPKGYQSWSDLAGICEGLGDRAVESAFDEWASQHPNSTKPISSFVKIGSVLSKKMVIVEPNPQLDEFCYYVSNKSDLQIIFNKHQRVEVSDLLDKYQYSEILLAFDKFYGIIESDSYQLKFGAKDFVEKAPQILETMRRRKAEADLAEKQLAEIKSRVAKEGASMVAESGQDELSLDDILGESTGV